MILAKSKKTSISFISINIFYEQQIWGIVNQIRESKSEVEAFLFYLIFYTDILFLCSFCWYNELYVQRTKVCSENCLFNPTVFSETN